MLPSTSDVAQSVSAMCAFHFRQQSAVTQMLACAVGWQIKKAFVLLTGEYPFNGETLLAMTYGADLACGAGEAIPIRDLQCCTLRRSWCRPILSGVRMSCTSSLIVRTHQGVMVKVRSTVTCPDSSLVSSVRCDNVICPPVNDRKPSLRLQTITTSPASHFWRGAESRRTYRSRLRGR